MDNLLDQFKKRMKISHSIEDEALQDMLNASKQAIKTACGDFADDDISARELILERTRYVYNDALEFFDDNFSSRVTSLALQLISTSEVIADD